MTSKTEILKSLSSEVFGETVLDISGKIIDALVKNKGSYQMLSYSKLKEIVGQKYSSEDIITAAYVLAHSKISVLKIHYAFCDEKMELFDIEGDELTELKENGRFTDPVTGELRGDYKENVVVYFTPNDQVVFSIK